MVTDVSSLAGFHSLLFGNDTSYLGTPSKPATNPEARGGAEWAYSSYQPPLFGGSQQVQPSDVVQQGSRVSDCYMLADLQALASIDAGFIRDHVKQLDNPSDPQHPNYQVTLYKEGAPIDVVVDGKQMLSTYLGANSAVGAGDIEETKQGPSTSLWPAIYEKAYAVATSNSMDSLDFSDPGAAWSVLTGASSSNTPMPASGSDFAAALAANKAAGGSMAMATADNLREQPGFDPASQILTFGDGRYQAKIDSTNVVAHVVDTRSPTKESWDIPTHHIMNVVSVTSHDSQNQDPAKVADNSKLTVNVQNPFGPSVTNQANLQSIPYEVMRTLSRSYVLLDAPMSSKG